MKIEDASGRKQGEAGWPLHPGVERCLPVNAKTMNINDDFNKFNK